MFLNKKRELLVSPWLHLVGQKMTQLKVLRVFGVLKRLDGLVVVLSLLVQEVFVGEKKVFKCEFFVLECDVKFWFGTECEKFEKVGGS